MSGSVGLACLFAFGLIRTINKVYRTRALHSRVTTKPPPLPSFGAAFLVDWVARVVCVSEKTLYDTAGLDALYFDRVNRLCLAISAFLALVNLGVILPVNYHLGTVISSVGATRVGGMSLMDKISMINVPAGSPLLWIHAAAVIVTVAFVSILLYQAFVDYREDRQSWLGHSVESAARAPLADEDDLAERRGTPQGADAPTDATEVSEGGGLTRRRTESVRRVDSMLRRGLSRHVLDHEQVEAANDRGSVVSEIHAPLSVFERQHVLLPSPGNALDRRSSQIATRAVKAQQYAVLVTNVDPSSGAFQVPGVAPNQSARLAVSRAFEDIFPDFVAAAPALYHRKVDAFLRALDRTQVSLLRLDERIRTLDADSERARTLAARREKLELEIKRLVLGVASEQRDAYRNPRSGLSYFVTFRSQVSASIAAQTLLQEPGSEVAWNVEAAPAPDDVNFSSLWMYPGERWWRSFVSKVAVAGIIIFPIGVFTSSMVSLSAALCARDGGFYWPWLCDHREKRDQTFFFRLLTAWVPSLLLATWNAVVVPYGMAWLALFEGTESTLSGIDRKVFRWFYLYACLNVLLGGMLAGTLFSQLENIIRSPSSVFVLLGHAVPQSSGFFLAYLSTNALMLEPARALVPHAGAVLFPVLRIFARTERDRADAWTPRSTRPGAHYGSQQLILLICLLFCNASPLVTAIGVVYFALSFVIWRYQLLYVFVRSYESGASFFPTVASRVICSLCIYQVFMSAYLLIKMAYMPAFILWITVPPFLWQFHAYCLRTFTTKSMYLPLALAKETPVADIPEDIFGAPQMHPTFKGWGAEVGKVWQGYGAFVKKFV